MPRAKASDKPAAAKKPATRARKPKVEAASVGLAASECASGDAPPTVRALEARVAAAGGAVLGSYREPLGGHWVVLASVPIDRIAPTPYQRELSKTHADKLALVIPKVGRFLDPVIAVATDDPPTGEAPAFITPNGMHRLTAMRSLGARAITALLVPEPEVAFRILALNTEKAHTLRDKALEVIRMARALAAAPASRDRPEADFAFEFELPSLLTLGICYEQNGRFSGGAYQPVLVRCERFADAPLHASLEARAEVAERVMALDRAVAGAVEKLKEAGWQSGYLKPIVVARINPLRFVKAAAGAPPPDLMRTLDKMIAAAEAFDPSKIKAADLAVAAAVGGGGDD
ncbi:MAG: hypothetical protein R2939_02670 [Kofleriaceae bacterium]